MAEYIERKDAIEALGEEPYVWSDTDVEIAEHNQWVSDVKAIEAVPSANVRPVVRGFNAKKDYPSLFECSVCGWECTDTIPCDTEFNFCPNCGADMRGGDRQ